jgi:hypothetical protein
LFLLLPQGLEQLCHLGLVLRVHCLQAGLCSIRRLGGGSVRQCQGPQVRNNGQLGRVGALLQGPDLGQEAHPGRGVHELVAV